MRDGADVPGLGVAAAVVGVTCCAGLPVITALIGGVPIAAISGVAAGVLALGAIATGAVRLIRARPSRNSWTTASRSLLP
jgi:hypothetical protein